MMILKSTRIFKLGVVLFLILSIFICFNTNYFGDSENSIFKSELFKLIVSQPSKEANTSISDISTKTKNISDRDVVYKKRLSFTGKTNMSELKDTKLNNGNVKFRAKLQNSSTTRIKDSTMGAENCTKKEVSLSQRQLPVTGLVSFPGSGNTWTRHLIQQMTGIKYGGLIIEISVCQTRNLSCKFERSKIDVNYLNM
jgi:hypothetical protein